MAVQLKKVKVKRTEYTEITDPVKLKEYIINLIAKGSIAALFMDPHILAAFYILGTAAANAIRDAILAHEAAPTKSNLDVIAAKMALAIIWLNSYADKVEVISNDDLNRTTREEAKINIEASYLTAQKLISSKKGDPLKPILVGKNIGTGDATIEIINGIAYQPSKMTFVAVEIAADPLVAEPVVALVVNGQLKITSTFGAEVNIISADGKGRYANFTGLKPGVRYSVYAFAQNGKKQISPLSVKIYVKG